ncbi:hypothetical protein PUR34_30420 [Streptomyces sp. JV185]|uniref:hypothetical protein n=1 Tax=Streptomyces sp. JV185 TaxID=858638 RepID=UPI002E78B3E6|nr:hypothetical protein [Streptomyces sp. JV185]MEE1772366.1 hypothetical protein [Streptomyces sp. JV185]
MPERAAGTSPEDAVFETLRSAIRKLLRPPALATAVIHSANTARASTVPDLARIDSGFLDLLLDAATFSPAVPVRAVRCACHNGAMARETSTYDRLVTATP